MAISLQKGHKVSLEKKSPAGLGEIHVNLNWNSVPQNQGFIKSLFGGQQGIDLDLGCPYVSLDGDARTGAAAAGENLRINGNQIANIKRVLVYTFIYEGVANWKQADATVTIRYPGAEDLIVKMDSYNSSDTMCALALLENVKDETFSVEKVVQFFRGHAMMDQAFGWGLNWKPGRN